MWLLPFFHRIASASLRVYYRVSREGHSVPAEGPVLVVANHPNSLLDPALVAFAARRPVRFIAKADLFEHPVVGWLVRGSGSIPVYRKQDDPTQMSRNVQMFDAVQEALTHGSAVALFPEGISHDAPSIAVLKTGAARIALGAAESMGHEFPIVPVGLLFRNKVEFRSRAHAIVGRQLEWRDLAGRGENDVEAVRILTNRIDSAIRNITVNLESWADAPLVELAESIYAAEFDLRPDAVERIARLKAITESLARLREKETGSTEWTALAEDVTRHGRMLHWFQLTPRSLKMRPRAGTAIGWTLRRLPLALAALSGVWVAGVALFWIPYRATRHLGSRAIKQSVAVVSTTKLIGGTLIFFTWFLILAGLVAFKWGIRPGLIAFGVLPILALVTLLLRESLANALREARRFLRVARRAGVMSELRNRQSELAKRIDLLWRSGQTRAATTDAPAPG